MSFSESAGGKDINNDESIIKVSLFNTAIRLEDLSSVFLEQFELMSIQKSIEIRTNTTPATLKNFARVFITFSLCLYLT